MKGEQLIINLLSYSCIYSELALTVGRVYVGSLPRAPELQKQGPMELRR